MEYEERDLTEALEYIPAGSCSYEEWINIGMALKLEGYPVGVWDSWSRTDLERYHAGECEKKWRTFEGAITPVTAGTIIQMAKEHGYMNVSSIKTYDWDDYIGVDKFDTGFVEPQPIDVNSESDPIEEILTYLETLFKPEEKVSYVFTSFLDEDGKYKPKGYGSSGRTAGELMKLLVGTRAKKKNKSYDPDDEIRKIFGDYDVNAGAWARFNPMDGNGVGNVNVTDYKYTLVESDHIDIEMQNALIREMKLPVAILMHSGGKSLHAIVRVDAPTLEIYKKRVNKIFGICDRYGFRVDTQNKNPARLGRIPGIIRGNKRQHIVDINLGFETFADWEEYIDGEMDDLPEPEDLFTAEAQAIELAPEVIQGILRQNRKMILTGASKAGKSFLLVELAMALATGTEWLGFKCNKNKVLYINFEIAKDAFIDRLKHIREALELDAGKLSGEFDTLNLRAYAEQFKTLLPAIKRRVMKGGYTVVVLDPIYKTLLGDENDAKVVSEFCNTLDKLCVSCNVTVIFCHHHNKSASENVKAQNRSSGSGVFARDPDAIFDLLEISTISRDGSPLEVNPGDKEKPGDKALYFRAETSLREFPYMDPFEIAFDYPIHKVVKGLETAQEATGGRTILESRQLGRDKQIARKNGRIDMLCSFIMDTMDTKGTPPTLGDAVAYFEGQKGYSEQNIRNWIKANDFLELKNGLLFYHEKDDE